MKDLETLKRLAKNPFYKMTDEEAKALKADKKKKSESPKAPAPVKRSSKDNAAVKVTGKLDKHTTDPVAE